MPGRETGPMPDDIEKELGREAAEMPPEDKELIKNNPELGELTLLDAGVSLIEAGQASGNERMVKEGFRVIESAREEMLLPREDDSKRVSRLKRVLQEVTRDFKEGAHGWEAGKKDIRQCFETIRNAGPETAKKIATASIELSRKQGLLHLIDDIKRGLREK